MFSALSFSRESSPRVGARLVSPEVVAGGLDLASIERPFHRPAERPLSQTGNAQPPQAVPRATQRRRSRYAAAALLQGDCSWNRMTAARYGTLRNRRGGST